MHILSKRQFGQGDPRKLYLLQKIHGIVKWVIFQDDGNIGVWLTVMSQLSKYSHGLKGVAATAAQLPGESFPVTVWQNVLSPLCDTHSCTVSVCHTCWVALGVDTVSHSECNVQYSNTEELLSRVWHSRRPKVPDWCLAPTPNQPLSWTNDNNGGLWQWWWTLIEKISCGLGNLTNAMSYWQSL